MTFSWATLELFINQPRRLPVGCTLEYEFRPSLYWYVDIHSAHAFWKKYNPGTPEGEFWRYDSEVREEWAEKYRQAKYKVYKKRRLIDCAWQRFTLTNRAGQQLILQMDRNGHVTELKLVERTIRTLVAA